MSTLGFLAALREQGIELQAWGDKLRYRPQELATPTLIAKLKVHKQELLKILTVDSADADKTPVPDHQRGGFVSASGNGIDFLWPGHTKRRCRDRNIPSDWTPRGWRKRLLHVADACEPYHPERAFELRRKAAATLPVYWFRLWRERAAIMEFDANMTRQDAESVAIRDILNRMDRV